MTFAIGVVSWPPVARLTRAEFMRIRGLDYVKASRAVSGAGPFYLIRRVILPNAAPPIVVAATLAIGTAILFASGLSFLGLGDPNVMSWGLMIGESRSYALDAWWTVALPGAAIFLAVVGVSLFGDAVQRGRSTRARAAGHRAHAARPSRLPSWRSSDLGLVARRARGVTMPVVETPVPDDPRPLVETRRAGGRVRLRQEHHRARDHGPAAGRLPARTPAASSLEGRGSSRRVPPSAPTRAARQPHVDDLPGADDAR